ncbi:hypothetical protein AVEN_252697-1 [Araneus ventricosus]|uniref:Retrovirus-related Pol polyprotein from transposon TNT 1-94-like beta-barrel domain-containing protein n=1 Tax=Araneus ventricosus TaxID=182803 RepID=A0A4Y2GR88_ARAVE|nr:hypothetical protein AVEN_252697-1 [Araneus ventricosus]
MMVAKTKERTFDELANQLYMFQRNFANSETNDKNAQEALAATNQGKQKHNSKGPFQKQSRKGETCNYCYKRGHWVKDCRKWIFDGRPNRKKPAHVLHRNTETANVSLLSICGEVCTAETDLRSFWIDNGATRHITNCPEYFVDFMSFHSPCEIKVAGKETLAALGKGNKTTVGEKCQEIMLRDVWYVPEISRNLFSVLAA